VKIFAGTGTKRRRDEALGSRLFSFSQQLDVKNLIRFNYSERIEVLSSFLAKSKMEKEIQ
jgi:hypothetical protein